MRQGRHASVFGVVLTNLGGLGSRYFKSDRYTLTERIRNSVRFGSKAAGSKPPFGSQSVN